MKKYLVLLSVSTLMSAKIVQAQENNVIEAPTPTVETAPAVTPKKVEATPLVLTPTPTTETAPTETPTPTEPTPVAPTTETAPTEAPTPTGPTPVAPKKTGTYQAPASQPKNTNISKAYKGISAVVLGLTVCLLSINSVALLSTQKKLAKTMDQVEKQTRVIEENNDNSTDVFSRYFISNYLRDAKTAGDFSNNDKLEKNGLNAPASVSSIMLFSKENKGDKYLMTYVVTYTVDTSTYSHKMSFEIKKSEKAKFGYLVTSDKITLSDYPK